MSTLPRYPKILALGHRAISKIFDGPVEITEKLDGSQFSFGKMQGELHCRSKSATINLDLPETMFRPAVEHVKKIAFLLPEGYTYYAETLAKPKHNALTYGRVPENHIALFGCMDNDSKVMLGYDYLRGTAKAFGIDVVPLLYEGVIYDVNEVDIIKAMLDHDSVLGNVKIEGVVVKNYTHDAMVGDVYYPYLVGKYVSEAFKEKHQHRAYGRKKNKESIDAFFDSYNTEARFNKAVQHLKEQGLIKGEPSDIGPLMQELNKDFEEECQGEVMEFLYKEFRKEALRRMSRGFPEWYKQQLAEGKEEYNKSVCDM